VLCLTDPVSAGSDDDELFSAHFVRVLAQLVAHCTAVAQSHGRFDRVRLRGSRADG